MTAQDISFTYPEINVGTHKIEKEKKKEIEIEKSFKEMPIYFNTHSQYAKFLGKSPLSSLKTTNNR